MRLSKKVVRVTAFATFMGSVWAPLGVAQEVFDPLQGVNMANGVPAVSNETTRSMPKPPELGVAQEPNANPVQPVQPAKAVDPATQDMRGPDVEALRYYAKNGDHDRYRAEFKRLTKLYPNWTMPADLFAEKNTNEQEFWDLYAQGRFDEIEELIRARQETNPSWTPTVELRAKLELRRTREAVVTAAETGEWQQVLQLVNDNPGLINGYDIEMLWYSAEAFAELGDEQNAHKTLLAALSISANGSLKSTTLQKAAAALSPEELELFIDEVFRRLDGSEDQTEVKDGIIRGLLEASMRTKAELSPKFQPLLEDFMNRVDQTNDYVDVELLAWSSFQQEDWEQAHYWFDKLPDDHEDAEVLEGKILALKHKGAWLAAFQRATAWRDLSVDIGRLYINLGAPYLIPQKPEKFDPEFLRIYAQKTSELQRGEGAEALGWYSYNIRQLKTSHSWFLKAVEWDETDTGAYGLMLSSRAARDRQLFDTYKRHYGPVYQLAARTEYNPCNDRNPIEVIYYERERMTDFDPDQEFRVERYDADGRYNPRGAFDRNGKYIGAYEEDRRFVDDNAECEVDDRYLNSVKNQLVDRIQGVEIEFDDDAPEWAQEERFQEQRRINQLARALRERVENGEIDIDEAMILNERDVRNQRDLRNRNNQTRRTTRVDRVTTSSNRRTVEAAPKRVTQAVPRKTRAPRTDRITTAATRKKGGGGSAALGQYLSRKDYPNCIRVSNALIAKGRMRASDYLNRGWCLLNMGRPTEADRSFGKSISMGGPSRADAAYGQSLAKLRNGTTNDAHIVAMNQPLSKKNRRDVDIAVLGQRAQKAYFAKDYRSALYALDQRRKRTPETRDLMLLRGWTLHHLGYKQQAYQVFQAVDTALSTRESRAALMQAKSNLKKGLFR